MLKFVAWAMVLVAGLLNAIGADTGTVLVIVCIALVAVIDAAATDICDTIKRKDHTKPISPITF